MLILFFFFLYTNTQSLAHIAEVVEFQDKEMGNENKSEKFECKKKSANCIKMRRGNKITPPRNEKQSSKDSVFHNDNGHRAGYIMTPSIITVTQKEALKGTVIVIIIIPHRDTNLFFLLHLSQVNLFQVPPQIWNPTSYRRLKKDGKFSPIKKNESPPQNKRMCNVEVTRQNAIFVFNVCVYQKGSEREEKQTRQTSLQLFIEIQPPC